MARKHRPPRVEVRIKKTGAMRGAAARAEHVARRLLRRTHLLAHRATGALPVVPTLEAPASHDGLITLPLPPLEHGSLDAHEREATALRWRAARAEHSAAWLRARLRAERGRQAAPPVIDAAALAADLARDLAKLPAHHQEAVLRVVRRRLAEYGLPVPGEAPRPAAEGARAGTARGLSNEARGGPGNLARGGPGGPTLDLPGWTTKEQEDVAARVLARVPEVADPAYVYRALDQVARQGRCTPAQLLNASGLSSPMARRRLRLAVEALDALGALTLQDGCYRLNTTYQPPRPERRDPPARSLPNQKGNLRRGPARYSR